LFLWILSVFCFTILKFWSLQFFFLSCYFVGFQKRIMWHFIRREKFGEIPKFLIFLLVILGVFKFFLVRGGGVCALFLWILRVFCFIILKFRSFQFFFLSFFGSSKKIMFFDFVFWSFGIFNFLFVILGSLIFFVCSFTSEEMGHVNFESFLFPYFEILESSIFFLLFWESLIFLCEVSQRGRYLLFFWKLGRSFVLIFWSSKVFNFLLVILGVFKFFCVKFS